MSITILGLGPGSPADLTRQAWDRISQANEVYLRTKHHPTVAALPSHLMLHTFDHLYETVDDFVTIYETIANRILALGRRPQGVLYAVPGHPRVGESSVTRILARAREEGEAVQLIDGLSFVEPVLSQLGIDGLAGLQLADATDLAARHHPPLDPDRPALIGQLYGQRLANEVKLTLMNAYPDEHPVTLVRAAGTAGATMMAVPLFQIDRDPKVDHLTTLYVPPLPQVGGLPAFQETVARLRAPEGCPWDREQTHESLRTNLLEETYEALTALDAGDADKLCEELGDLLMQIALHAQIATEEGTFKFPDLIGRIDAKLKRRHPHVFGDVSVESAADVLRNWEAIKASERAEEGEAHRSTLEGVPITLPALARAQELADRAARIGFDRSDPEGLWATIREETAALRARRDADDQARELGDLLFSLADVARWLGLDAESALRGACDRFVRRHVEMERATRASGTI
jgi:tetrapyrrole methylase family protein/MazG family protein